MTCLWKLPIGSRSRRAEADSRGTVDLSNAIVATVAPHWAFSSHGTSRNCREKASTDAGALATLVDRPPVNARIRHLQGSKLRPEYLCNFEQSKPPASLRSEFDLCPETEDHRTLWTSAHIPVVLDCGLQEDRWPDVEQGIKLYAALGAVGRVAWR